jgi:hypothetical protein
MLAIVALGVTISIVSAIVYTRSQEPEFNVILHLLPPKHQDIESLYLPTVITRGPTPTTPWTPRAPNVIAVTTTDVFGIFHRYLLSGPLQSKFLAETSTPLNFNVGLDIGNLYVSSDWHDPDEAKNWAIDYVEFVAQYSISQILADLQNSIDSRIRVIQHSLGFLHIVANKQKETEIIKLNEALDIAKKLNVVEPITQTPLPPDSVPLYYIGSKAIQAQLDVYVQSKPPLLHKHGATQLSIQLSQLREIDVKPDGIRIVEIIQEPTVSQKPIRPTAKNIIGIGIVMSCLGAIFLVFCMFYIQRQRLLTKDQHRE